MDLRRARTFVTVADLGTVSQAALHLRVAQPASSRQLGELERELGFKLFDRVGRGLVLTGEGEQLLVDCRGLLNYAEAIGERAQLFRRGDRGVLKVAASPQFIEGTLAEFLHQYAKLFPNVQVKLREAIGWSEIKGLLERGDIHLGQNLANAVQLEEQRFESHRLEPVELLLAFQPRLAPGSGSSLEIDCLTSHPLLLLDTSYVFRRTFDAACRLAGLLPTIAFESRTPHTLGYSLDDARAFQSPARGAPDIPPKETARTVGHFLGWAASAAALRHCFLPRVGGSCPRRFSCYGTIRSTKAVRTDTC